MQSAVVGLMPDYIKPYVSYLMNFGACRGNARQETIMNENTSGVKTASDKVVHHCCMTWILHNRKHRRYLWLSTLAAFCVRTTCKQECIMPKLHTLNYPGNGSDSSSSVNTYYYCYLCCVYTSSCAWCMMSGSLFLMLLAGCANENITLCLNAAVEMLQCEEHCLHDCPQAAERRKTLRLRSLCSYYLPSSSTCVWKWPP